MNSYLFFIIIFLYSVLFKSLYGQCSGGIWSIEDAIIGSFTISWRYSVAGNTVQFIIQGQTLPGIDVSSTYFALAWSNTAPTMDNMDVAIFYGGTQIIQDRYSQGHKVPLLDSQQDFCLILTNQTDKNIYVAFERFSATGDIHDISFLSNLYLMFAMGSYTNTTDSNILDPQFHFYRTTLQTTTNLMTCVANSCLTVNCTIASCPCLQQIISQTAQCICFPPSSCVSGSTLKPVTTSSTTPSITSSVGILNGLCLNLANPCSSNGLCLQISATQYACQCKINYTGVMCETALFPNNMTNLSSCLCFNGGTCLENGTCLCSDVYRGKYCQLNNPCIGYCLNGATCSVMCTDTSCSLPNCNCKNGTTGTHCETMFSNSACQSNPCIHGDCTAPTNGTFQCQCQYGFFGSRCELINSCLSNPCHQGTCVVSSNCFGLMCTYSCLCPNGTTGQNCEFGGNPCLSAPCKNNGGCIQLPNAYICQCLSPYAGTNCDLIINVCTPNPCLNNGLCIRNTNILDGTYQCNCPSNYIGTRCESLNPCISSPCMNGGLCMSSNSNCSTSACPMSCLCPAGTTGVYCEKKQSLCLTLPCLNGGTCVSDPLTNISYCQCQPHVNGSRCEAAQSICTSSSCSNNGVCYIDLSFATTNNSTFGCVCSPGYTGQYCQSSISSCLQNPCGYNGTCFPTSNSTYYCMCPNGFLGPSCNSQSVLTSCLDSPCHYLATCQQISGTNGLTYKCMCPDYLTGDRCQYINNCQKQPCLNQGTCIPLGPQNNFMCLCQPGFGNYDCSINFGLTCNSNTCLNGGTCDYNNTNIRCVCPINFAGARCEWNATCSSNTCLNGGTCRQKTATVVECLCAPGFTGPICSLRDSCFDFPCKNGAACKTLLTSTNSNRSTYQCTCPPGVYGQNCDTTVNSCATTTCPSYKICSEQPTGPVCTCPANKVGTFCQYDNPCSQPTTAYCFNSGTCISSNTDPPKAVCLCPENFTGVNCNLTLNDHACASSPCQNRGYCALPTSKQSYTCICQSNYVGDECERSNPCTSSPCLNEGICQGSWNETHTWYACLCIGTFTGTKCETSLVNPCGGLCMNGNPCINGTCACSEKYTGTFCGFDNPCYNPICLNGGFCSANYNSTSASFTCTCRNSFTGQFCETPVSTQGLGNCTCNNGGSCVNGLCICTPQYVGPSCQYESPCINHNPCFNGGTCFGQYNSNGNSYAQCFCPQGYTGLYCETTLCTSTSCNGGECLATQNTIVCTCPTGKVGDRCQYADACMHTPCLPSERCEQSGNQYRCISCFDQSTLCTIYQKHSEFCQSFYALNINNVLIPVLEACQRSCNQCIPILNATTYPLSKMNDDSTLNVQQNHDISFSLTNIGFECIDRRTDCEQQKAYGFCKIFNEKYPNDCKKTCHPDCVVLS